ncbi:MAG: hypothetical protein QOG43_2135 [Actinomycetota bacterium]|nr:hypothetical protein [Actinomycetota bacterium]
MGSSASWDPGCIATPAEPGAGRNYGAWCAGFGDDGRVETDASDERHWYQLMSLLSLDGLVHFYGSLGLDEAERTILIPLAREYLARLPSPRKFFDDERTAAESQALTERIALADRWAEHAVDTRCDEVTAAQIYRLLDTAVRWTFQSIDESDWTFAFWLLVYADRQIHTIVPTTLEPGRLRILTEAIRVVLPRSEDDVVERAKQDLSDWDEWFLGEREESGLDPYDSLADYLSNYRAHVTWDLIRPLLAEDEIDELARWADEQLVQYRPRDDRLSAPTW